MGEEDGVLQNRPGILLVGSSNVGKRTLLSRNVPFLFLFILFIDNGSSALYIGQPVQVDCFLFILLLILDLLLLFDAFLNSSYKKHIVKRLRKPSIQRKCSILCIIKCLILMILRAFCRLQDYSLSILRMFLSHRPKCSSTGAILGY